MIKFPKSLTPVPKHQGYFWDVELQKLFSIKVGGELRELKVRRIHGSFADRFPRRRIGDLHYCLSQSGKTSYVFVRDLKKLKVEDYDIPVVMRTATEETNDG